MKNGATFRGVYRGLKIAGGLSTALYQRIQFHNTLQSESVLNKGRY